MEEIINDETLENRILVIGNGFDIANQYKTRYSDFISFIKNKGYELYKDNKEYAKFCNLITENHFIKHFIDNSFDYTIWSDVEIEIKKIIDAIKTVYNDEGDGYEYKTLPDSHRAASIKTSDPYVRKILKEFDLIEVFFGSFILPDKYFDYYNKINWIVLNGFLTKELDDFKDTLIIYLKEFVPLIYSTNCQSISKKSKEQLCDIKPRTIITFNYTDYYKNIFDSKKVIHVHGSLENNKIVLGFNDEDDDLHYVKFKKYFQRIQNKLEPIVRKSSIFNYEESFLSELTEEKIFCENIIYFYGVSFDKTDEDIIGEIYHSDNTKKIIVYYYDDLDYENKIVNLIQILGKDKVLEDRNSEKLEFIKIEK